MVHYQVPILDGQDVFMEFKSGSFIECDPPGSGNPPPGFNDCGIWNFQSDWKAPRSELAQWVPV